jgi:branched-chain amino acid transport system ATP-binding protein
MSLLEVRGLRAGYEGIPVVFGIDLEVGEDSVVTLLGANGAGKTTTLRAISGLVRPMAGSVVFDGQPVGGLSPERVARLGLLHVPEGRGVFPSLAVDETLRLVAALAGLTRSQARERIEDAYVTFPRLADRRGQLAGTLSGGEQQMLALARGIIARPRLLMIDEMSQGLAPTIVASLFEIVAGFPAKGVSVLLVEQFVGQALGVASRAYVLEKGEVSFAGAAAELAADESFVRGSYLGEVAAVASGGGPLARASGDGGRPPIGEEVSVRLPAALIRGIQERARKEGKSPDELVWDLVAGMVQERGTPRRRQAARPARRRDGRA